MPENVSEPAADAAGKALLAAETAEMPFGGERVADVECDEAALPPITASKSDREHNVDPVPEQDIAEAGAEEAQSDANEAEAQPVSGKRTRPSEEPADDKKKKSKSNESSVVYVTRIPPGMDVGALRARLARMGTLGRVWLQMEDQSTVAARRQLGGRRSKGFADGWVEFTRRRDAKNAVALLNGRPINAAKRGGRWANDLWCLKLLPRDYTWQHLYEETTGGARERVLRMKAAVAAGRRERVFLEERDALARRIAAKEAAAAGEDADSAEPAAVSVPERRIVRRFRQRQAVTDAEYEDDVDERRARAAARRLEDGGPDGDGKAEVDKELVQMLFGRKKAGGTQETT